ncbi:MAG: CNNM domain-containing protein [Chthoniobacter sp.]|nr:CNNM domain-containing protein [Chthoniobacter sp.]
MIWLAISLCLLVSVVFSGIEAGILSVNRVRLKHRVKLRDRAALRLDRLLEQPERLLVTVLVVTNLMNIFAITLLTQEFVVRLGGWGYPAVLATFLPVYLFGLELLPKSLFRRFPYRALAALTGPLRLADLLLAPMHAAGSALSRLLFKKRPAPERKLFVAREDFKYLTIESERTGALGREERQMIHNVVDFRAVTARDVMVPLADVRSIPAQADLAELLDASRATGLERWPVVAAGGEITGLVLVFEIALDGRKRGPIEPYQRRIVKVAENEPAYSVLRKLRAARITMAVVGDPAGKQLGLVTWEDLIRRLVTIAAA